MRCESATTAIAVIKVQPPYESEGLPGGIWYSIPWANEGISNAWDFLCVSSPAHSGRTFLLLVCLNLIKKGQKMKRIISLILAVVVAFTLASCEYFNVFGGDVAEQGDVTVVVEAADGAYEVYKTYLENVKNKNDGGLGVLENLETREENPLNLKVINGSYGAFVEEIGSIKQDAAKGEYIMFYTSLESDSYLGAPTLEYEGITLYQSGVGISSIRVESGSVILFRLEKY